MLRRQPSSKRAGIVTIVLCLAILAIASLQACANSILRNTGEAALETVLDVPLPTPTVERR